MFPVFLNVSNPAFLMVSSSSRRRRNHGSLMAMLCYPLENHFQMRKNAGIQLDYLNYIILIIEYVSNVGVKKWIE